MAKRFTDTEKWTKNKWFRKLSKDVKIFWLFVLDNCDMVGVWEEDVEFVCGLLDLKTTKEEILKECSTQIKEMPGGKKWWIIGFCYYQYGILKIENTKNKPHQRYISELKKHRLWIDYTKTIHSLEEKEKEEEKEDIDNTSKDETENFTDEQKAKFKEFTDWVKKNAPRVLKMKEPLTIEQYFKLVGTYGKIGYMVKAMHNHKPLLDKNISAYLTLNNWLSREENKAS